MELFCLNTNQDPDAEVDPNEVVKISKAEAEKTAEASLKAVFEHGTKIDLDHHLVYHARRSTPLICLVSNINALTSSQIMNSVTFSRAKAL